MRTTETLQGRAVADQLADVRREIARLQKVEQRLRNEILATGEHVVDGAEYMAVVTSFTARRLDAEALKAELGEEGVRHFMRETETSIVRIFPLHRRLSRGEWGMIQASREER